jgi:hypothetical protein
MTAIQAKEEISREKDWKTLTFFITGLGTEILLAMNDKWNLELGLVILGFALGFGAVRAIRYVTQLVAIVKGVPCPPENGKTIVQPIPDAPTPPQTNING